MQFAMCAADPNLSGITAHLQSYRELVRTNLGGLVDTPTKTLERVLDEHGAPSFIEFLSIDTEGSEYEVSHAELARVSG